MTTFFHWWVIVITLVNIFACYWLIKWTMKARPGESKMGEVTGHEWDGLQELNNPLPRWWLWMFYLTIIFSLVYLVLYPGLGNFQGVLGWSQEGQYDSEIEYSQKKYGPLFAKFAAQSVEDLAKDKKALKAGERLFSNYCSQCHGSDAQGVKGYPNLADNDWLYGGSADAIKQSILNGRSGMMPGHHAQLQGEKGVNQVAAYVMSLSGRQMDAELIAAGKTHFDTYCFACHGADGTGNQALGAPNLTDQVWLYGATASAIKDVISKGRQGKMPAHNEFLGQDKSHLLAAYVYSLSPR